MSDCPDNVQKRGTSNPIQSKIVENDHGSGGGSTGDNTIENATCDATVTVGSVVRFNGVSFVNALANNFGNSKVIGICTSKSDATTCNVQVTGFTSSIFAGLTSGASYFLSETTPGGITSTPPSGSGEYVIKIGTGFEANKLVIQIERIVKRV